MSARTLMSRSPSSSMPHFGSGVVFGSKPMFTRMESTSKIFFLSVRLSYTIARSTQSPPSMLVTSALKTTWIGFFMTASTFFSIARNSPRRWTRATDLASATISSAIAHAILDSMSVELRLARNAELLRLEQAHAHREDDRPRFEALALSRDDRESRGSPFDVHDLLVAHLCAALPRMESEQLPEFPALDRDVAGVILHGLRRVEPGELASDRLGLEDQGRKLPRPCVHARGEPGGPTSDDDHVVRHVGGRASKTVPS